MNSLAIARTDSAELFVRWQQHGDHSARDELVGRFLPLARKLARRYAGAREPFEDLLQVASLGLVKAVDRFDADRGTAFSSFAVPTILGELKRYFRDLGWSVHVPRGAQEQALKVEEAQQNLTSKTGRPPRLLDHVRSPSNLRCGYWRLSRNWLTRGAHNGIASAEPIRKCPSFPKGGSM